MKDDQMLVTFRLLIIMFLSLLMISVPKQSTAMTFQKSGNGGNCIVGCEYIIASGEITLHSGAEFHAFLASIYPWTPRLVLIESTGGNLFGGLELGRAFRSHNLAVYVGKVLKSPDFGERTIAGVCYSACAYALLGGTQRGIYDTQTMVGDPSSQIGFHQFYSNEPDKLNEINLLGQNLKFSEDQIVSGLIANYLSEMGVDTRVLLLASSTSGNDIYVPSIEEMLELNVTKDITSPFSKFQLEIYNGSLLLFSTRLFEDLTNQISQVTFLCQNGFVSMLVTSENTAASGAFLNVDRKFSSEDSNSFMSISVDGEYFRADHIDISEHFSTNGIIHYASLDLGEGFITTIERADILEISYEIPRAAGNFHATLHFDETARSGLSYLRKTCL